MRSDAPYHPSSPTETIKSQEAHTARKTSTGWSLWSQENHRLISLWDKINASQGNTSDSSGLLKAIILELNVRASFMCAKERKCYVWGKQQYYVNQIRSSLLAASIAPTISCIHLASHSTLSRSKALPRLCSDMEEERLAPWSQWSLTLRIH